MSKNMTYRRPISGRAAVECSNGNTLEVELRSGYPTIVMGTFIDRLHDYETLGSPEYFKSLIERHRIQIARATALNSVYGILGGRCNGKSEMVRQYIENDIKMTADLWEKVNPHLDKTKPALPEIDRVIFNAPATIVFWKDDTKTVVKANNGEPYDPEKGLAMAMLKKALGNEGNYYKVIRKALDKNPHNASEVAHVKDIAAMYHCLKRCEKNVNTSYSALYAVLNNKKATKADLLEAIELSVGHLGELLDDGGPVNS